MGSCTVNVYRGAKFLKSASELSQLPSDFGIEVAFAGRSNAGKSSALNTLTNQKGLAKTSKMPGRTQLINLFEFQPNQRLVDLPGYGYAAVPKAIKERWQLTLGEYLNTRSSLKGLVLLMDCRHPLQDTDQSVLSWARGRDLPCHILLTKSDKLSFQQQIKTQATVELFLANQAHSSVQFFSSPTKQGLQELCQQLNTWFKAAG